MQQDVPASWQHVAQLLLLLSPPPAGWPHDSPTAAANAAATTAIGSRAAGHHRALLLGFSGAMWPWEQLPWCRGQWCGRGAHTGLLAHGALTQSNPSATTSVHNIIDEVKVATCVVAWLP